MFTSSWKTTTLGVLAFANALLVAIMAELDMDPSTKGDWNSVVSFAIAMGALFFARDHKVTDEEVKK